MAIKLIEEKWAPLVGHKRKYILDTEADVADLPDSAAGSTAVVIATANVYAVNASGQWALFGEG